MRGCQNEKTNLFHASEYRTLYYKLAYVLLFLADSHNLPALFELQGMAIRIVISAPIPSRTVEP